METTVYRILPGDNLTKIAAIKGIEINQILDVNPQIIHADEITAGQPINLPITYQQISTQWPAWYKLAHQEQANGINEVSGQEHNPRIIEYHDTTTLKAGSDETPWCSAFVNWCITNTGFPGTNSAAARSWLTWGKKISEPITGCVVVLKRGNQPWQGHVGFFVDRPHQDYIRLLGGNQNNQVKISTYLLSSVLGYRWHD